MYVRIGSIICSLVYMSHHSVVDFHSQHNRETSEYQEIIFE